MGAACDRRLATNRGLAVSATFEWGPALSLAPYQIRPFSRPKIFEMSLGDTSVFRFAFTAFQTPLKSKNHIN